MIVRLVELLDESFHFIQAAASGVICPHTLALCCTSLNNTQTKGHRNTHWYLAVLSADTWCSIHRFRIFIIMILNVVVNVEIIGTD
jgi:hypothetical protein